MLRFNDNNEVISEMEHRAVLVGLQLREDIETSMEELRGLAEADDVEVLGIVIQSLDRPDKATYIGKGKVLEITEYCEAMEADTLIFNDELSGAQIRNLEEATGVRVIDRTILILDIFARRASTKEGKLQVELAQLAYRLPRLTGFGKSLSRLGGGIGTRGPGEKKLETDRRHITRRMDDIKAELAKARSVRKTQRARREKSQIPVAALVGYTNSGKSALMNRILSEYEKQQNTEGRSDADTKLVFEEDMLFATLDTYQRGIKLDNNREFILVDTVGFVSKLPHSLVEAFKATLEEVVMADLLIHVVDVSRDDCEFCLEVTRKVLGEIGAGGKKEILAYNKCDLMEDRIINVHPAEGEGEGGAPDAPVSGIAYGAGNAPASGNAYGVDNAPAPGSADGVGNAPVSGSADGEGNAPVSGDANGAGNAHFSADAYFSGNAPTSGSAPVSGGNGTDSLFISAKRGDNIGELIKLIEDALFEGMTAVTLLIPYDRGDVTSYICDKCNVFSLDYKNEGTMIEAELDQQTLGRYRQFVVRQQENVRGSSKNVRGSSKR